MQHALKALTPYRFVSVPARGSAAAVAGLRRRWGSAKARLSPARSEDCFPACSVAVWSWLISTDAASFSHTCHGGSKHSSPPFSDKLP
eukprot:3687634-Amphidinium_carterae.1